MKASSKRKRKESSEGDSNKQRTLLSFFSTSPKKKVKNENDENENHNRANDDLVEEEDAMIAVPSATSSLPSLSRGSNRRTTNGATKSAVATSSLHLDSAASSQALPAFTARASGRHGTGRTAGGGAPSMASSLRRRNHHLGGGGAGGPRPLLLPGDTIMPRGAGGRWQQEEVEAAVMDRMLSDRDVYDADPSQPKPQDAEPNRASLLSDEQRAALQVALEGVSFFFTGSAGTGKSFLLKEMITQLRRKHREGIFVTASTGVAACNIGGVTLHGFAGVGLANGSAESLASQVANAKWTLARWRSAKVLVVDEVSMLEAEFFDKMEKVARIVRDSHLPFGGIQIILCGDFLQLPPVVKGRDHKFCFQADCWSSVIKRTIILQQVFRQADEQFVGILNQIRVGRLSPEARRILEGRLLGPASTATAKQPEPDSAGESEGEASGEKEKEIVATRLYSHRRDVDAENVKCLQDINTESHTFYAEDEGTNPYLKQLQQNCPAPYELELKVGAQVILLKNLDFENELVNGARGLVVEFRKPDRSEREKERDKAFAKQEYPDVLFANGHRRILTPEQFSVEVGGSVKASRKQVPLGLAWALSIHKSQGMTISKVELHLGNVFEYGQAYVALSRATSLEGLRLLSFNPAGIKAHPRVLQFYQSLLGRPLFADQSSQPTTISTTTTTTTTASSAQPPRTMHGDRGGMSFPSSAPAQTTTRSSAVSLRSTSSSSSPSTFSFAPASSSSASSASPYFASPVPSASSPILLRGRKGGSPHQKRAQTHTAPSASGVGVGAQSETTLLANDAVDDLFFWQHFVAQELDFSAASAAASSSPDDSSPASSAGGAAAGGELLSSPPSSVSTTPASSQSQREPERREDEQVVVEVAVPEDLGHAMEEDVRPADDASHDAQDENQPSQEEEVEENKEEDQDAEAEEKQKGSGEGGEEAAPRAEERVFLSARDLLRRLAGGGPGDDHREKGV